MEDDYTKIVYQSKPIGKERIILYLTTFDIEKWNRDKKLEKVPTQKKSTVFEYEKSDLLNPNFINEINQRIDDEFNKVYKKQIEDLKGYIEINRKMPHMEWSKPDKIKNITNSNDVHCDIVQGNIVNCNDIYCNEIKGNVVNCNKIIYK